MSALYHFTCRDHGAPGIRRTSQLRPHPQVQLGGIPLVWLTDRTEYRVSVAADTPGIVHWPSWAREHRVPWYIRDDLERFGLPMHWWVSERPIPILSIATALVPR